MENRTRAHEGTSPTAAEPRYLDLGGGTKLLWSADFGGDNPARELRMLEKLCLGPLAAPGSCFIVLEASAGETRGRVARNADAVLRRGIQAARESYGSAALVEDCNGELHILADGPGDEIDMTMRRGGDRAAALLKTRGAGSIQNALFSSAWLSFEKAWVDSAPLRLSDSLEPATEPTAPERPRDAKATEAPQKAAPQTDGRRIMEENGNRLRSYPLTVRRNFIMSDRATGEPVVTERVGKTSGKSYRTCQVTIPGGVSTVQDGKAVDLSGYQVVLFVNKNVLDLGKRDVTFYLDSDRDIRLFKTDRETGERSHVTVTAGELSHAVAQERKTYRKERQKGGEESSKAAFTPRREVTMTPESAAEPPTERQLRKLDGLREKGAVTQGEIDAVSNKGEASQLISLALERPVHAPEGYRPEPAPAKEDARPTAADVQVYEEDVPF